MYKWNVNFQRELTGRTTLEVGYTGTRGKNLFRQIFTNGRKAVDVNGRLVVAAQHAAASAGVRPHALRVSDADSWYKGLTVGLSRRGRRPVDADVVHARNPRTPAPRRSAATTSTAKGAGRATSTTTDKGLSPFDIRQSFVASVNYLLPFGRGAPGATAALIRDWRSARSCVSAPAIRSRYFVGLRARRQPGAPDYPDLCPGASANPILGGPDKYYDPGRSVCSRAGVIGNAPRNSLIGPGFATLDLMTSRSRPSARREPAASIRSVQPAQPRELCPADPGDLQPGLHLSLGRRPYHEHCRHAATDAARREDRLVIGCQPPASSFRLNSQLPDGGWEFFTKE